MLYPLSYRGFGCDKSLAVSALNGHAALRGTTVLVLSAQEVNQLAGDHRVAPSRQPFWDF
jgi:hypothetical protein